MAKEDTKNTTVRKESFWNKEYSGAVVFLIIFILVISYFYLIAPRQECAGIVEYFPAGSPIKTDNSFRDRFNEKLAENEYYYYKGRMFQTKNEAVSYCLAEG